MAATPPSSVPLQLEDIQRLDYSTAINPDAWPPRNRNIAYDWSKPTIEMYRDCEEKDGSTHQTPNFASAFGQARQKLDYSYHARLVLNRQLLQDAILGRVASSATSRFSDDENVGPEEKDAGSTSTATRSSRPWIVFTAGAMGVGKGYVVTQLQQQKLLDLSGFVKIDPDMIKSELPEMAGYIQQDRSSAATKLHRESTQMADILFEDAISRGMPILVDGSLRDVEYYQSLFQRIHNDYPMYKIAILHIVADREVILERAKQRAVKTGRVVPHDLLERSMQQVPRSVQDLSQFADVVHVIGNNEDQPLQLVSSTTTKNTDNDDAAETSWDSFARSFADEEAQQFNVKLFEPQVVHMATVFDSPEAHQIANSIWMQSYPNFCARCALACDGQCGICIHGRHLCACFICNPQYAYCAQESTTATSKTS